MAENEISAHGPTPPITGTVTIDGVDYALEQLSEEARNQVHNVRMTDVEIARIRQQLAIMQTARAAYAAALKNALPRGPVVN